MVGEQLGKEGAVKIDSTFIEDLDADSLDTIELIMKLEQEFAGEKAKRAVQCVDYLQDVVVKHVEETRLETSRMAVLA